MKRFRLERRTFLRAAGVSISLPWLEAMVKHEAKAAAATPARFAGVFFGNGVLGLGAPGSGTTEYTSNYWHCVPASTDTNWALSRTLKPLEKHKALITYFKGLEPRELRNNQDGHWTPACSYLTGLRHTSTREGGGQSLRWPLPLGSLDQAIAKVLGCKSLNMAPFPNNWPTSSEPGRGAGVFLTNVSWISQSQVAPRHQSSAAVYDELFKTPPVPGSPTLPPSTAGQIRTAERSILDLVYKQAESLQKRLGTYDRERVGHYLQSVREVERSIAAETSAPPTPPGVACNPPARDAFNDGSGGAYLDQRNKNMADLLALAFRCNRTQVATWMLDGEHNYDRMGARIPNYSGPAGGADAHIISHHKSADHVRAFALMNDWHVRKFTYLCDRLAEVTEANGKTVLENSVLMFGTGMADGDAHGAHDPGIGTPAYKGIARILVGNGGGMFRAGRFIDTNHAHHANLLLALAQKFGVATDKFGNSDGVVSLP